MPLHSTHTYNITLEPTTKQNANEDNSEKPENNAQVFAENFRKKAKLMTNAMSENNNNGLVSSIEHNGDYSLRKSGGYGKTIVVMQISEATS
ncbi:hypothetical protein CASFOL_004439 [Castilleja foliolosa]|uniref:Uncharacterized protein n=1 Tax=Castilleja foliolosa TaxID=1961234 RepID=A0ABD3EB17_9LAMI